MKRIVYIFLTVLTTVYVSSGCGQKQPDHDARMDRLMKDIHGDLKKLSHKDNWLTLYKDKCFSENYIFYMPPQKKTDRGGPAMPDQILIRYHPVNMKKEGKYLNHFASEKSSYFPSPGYQVQAVLILRKKKDAELKEKIKQVIISRCKALHRELDK